MKRTPTKSESQNLSPLHDKTPMYYQKIKSTEMANSCECIIEMYELLWRLSNSIRGFGHFYRRFGFRLPHTIVIIRGKLYAWYFSSARDGSILRKRPESLNFDAVLTALCYDRTPPGRADVAAVWLPGASQFPEDRCPIRTADFLSSDSVKRFVHGKLNERFSGVLQQFVYPPGVFNVLLRSVKYDSVTSLAYRSNRYLMTQSSLPIFWRCATYEGWEGLSCERSARKTLFQPAVEQQAGAASRKVFERIEKDDMKAMLFLSDNDYIALHYKVGADGLLYFSFASLLGEKEARQHCHMDLIMESQVLAEPYLWSRRKRKVKSRFSTLVPAREPSLPSPLLTARLSTDMRTAEADLPPSPATARDQPDGDRKGTDSPAFRRPTLLRPSRADSIEKTEQATLEAALVPGGGQEGSRLSLVEDGSSAMLADDKPPVLEKPSQPSARLLKPPGGRRERPLFSSTLTEKVPLLKLASSPPVAIEVRASARRRSSQEKERFTTTAPVSVERGPPSAPAPMPVRLPKMLPKMETKPPSIPEVRVLPPRPADIAPRATSLAKNLYRPDEI
ncbi:unnamed protein product [Vitrella brassicaformis CCMP3155]|uniref:Uncharacterized protein n=2 Tax=Vitrella brassicaformis TaxID=1169539 RepID=A0A0G4H1D0_VITBC|nr:unnamed protein product [Vitrella brassicaformis CCMP3155]|eukprot:CEM37400.1 unnamed protein product [Vitrella brassicaformis CCMP3155]